MTTYPLAEKAQSPGDPLRRAARTYVILVICGVLAVAMGLGAVALKIGPPVGDLGRISGLGSHDFGRQGQFEFYAQEHFIRGPLQAHLNEEVPADILIFGDSFSRSFNLGEPWINDIYAQTGLQPYSVPLESFQQVLSYLDSRGFAQNPPRAVIIEVVERHVVSHALSIYDPASCAALPPAPVPLQGLVAPVLLERVTRPAKTGFQGLEELLSWGALAIKTRLRGQDTALTVDLSRQGLFSSRRQNQVLVYHEDLTRHAHTALAPLSVQEAEHRFRCGLRRLVSARADVPIWVIIAPDKRSIYAPWITSSLPEKALNIPSLAETALGPAYINVHALLSEAASAGQVDLYWPDDTHWGVAGNRLVGAYVAERITSPTLPPE